MLLVLEKESFKVLSCVCRIANSLRTNFFSVHLCSTKQLLGSDTSNSLWLLCMKDNFHYFSVLDALGKAIVLE